MVPTKVRVAESSMICRFKNIHVSYLRAYVLGQYAGNVL